VKIYYEKAFAILHEVKRIGFGRGISGEISHAQQNHGEFFEIGTANWGKHLRVRGLKAVRFCVFLKALGLNILRFAAWIAGGGKVFVPEPRRESAR